jgi:hypothetical protein
MRVFVAGATGVDRDFAPTIAYGSRGQITCSRRRRALGVRRFMADGSGAFPYARTVGR